MPKRSAPASIVSILLCQLLAFPPLAARAATLTPDVPGAGREKVIIDTDIGSDVDDAFAIALALRSPELDILGFSTASGDTAARAKILRRLLEETGYAHIPITVGVPTTSPSDAYPPSLIDLQGRYGQNPRYAGAPHADAIDFILGQIRRFPGQITLIAIGPMSNIAALIDKDKNAVRQLKRIVAMGGWLRPLEDGIGHTLSPRAEYNVSIDVRAAQKVFQSGVPLQVFPLDSTLHLTLDEVKRKSVFSSGTPLTDSLGVLYLLWGRTTPVLYDPLAVAFTTRPELCALERMSILVDDEGVTRTGTGPRNAEVCMKSNATGFFDYFMERIVDRRAASRTE
jgi:inosine-uridine nucleoside N-ribohydrolase